MYEVAAYSTVAMTLGLVVTRPRVGPTFRLSPAMAAFAGVAFMMLLGIVGLDDWRHAAADLWSPFAAIASIMIMTEVALRIGLLDWGASVVDARATSPAHLFGLVFWLGVATAASLNNDAAILLLTPLVVTLVRRRYPERPDLVLPFAFAVFMSAGVAALPVSNPMNMVVAELAGIGFNEYAVRMIPVAVAGWVIAYLVLRRVFRRELARMSHHPDGCEAHLAGTSGRTSSRPSSRTSVRSGVRCGGAPRSSSRSTPLARRCGETYGLTAHDPATRRGRRRVTPAQILMMVLLGGVLLAYSVVGYFGGPVWAVAACGALMALGLASVHQRENPLRVIRHGVSWSTLAFLAAVLILATGLFEVGLVGRLTGYYADASPAAIGVTSALGSAVLNNHPMAYLNMMALDGSASGDVGVLAALVGGDLGPRLLPMGSLAGLLWLEMLRRQGVEVRLRTFVKVGALVTLPAIAASLVILSLY